MRDRLDALVAEQPRDLRAAQVDPADVDAVEQPGRFSGRRGKVDADDPLDPRIGGEPAGHLRTEVACDPGDQDDPGSTHVVLRLGAA